MQRLAVAALVLALTILSAAGPAPAAVTEQVPLKQLATAARGGNGILIGSAMRAARLTDPDYSARAAAEFSLITPESELTWEALEGVRGTHNFTQADQLVAYAEANGQKVVGKHLAWHSAIPGWWPRLADRTPDPNAFTEAEARAMLKGHIEATMAHYRGRVAYWSVVNEALADGGGLRNGIWRQKLGDGYIAEAFRWARAADPTAKLYLNEYGVENHSAKGRTLYDLVKSLRAQGVPIDGVGFQTHRMMNDGLSGFADVLRRFADLGVEVYVTELDVRIPDAMTSGAELGQQADVFGQATAACLAVTACKFMNLWGFTDRYSWIKMIRPTWGRATLLTETLANKPAYERVAAVLRDWARPATDPSGWWRLDDWLPPGAPSGVASDSSGNNRPASAGTALGCEGRSVGVTAFCGDGVASGAQTSQRVVDTDRSFTVSAWVRLDDAGRDQVVASQDGQTRAAFTLGYDTALNRWTFAIPVADSPGAATVRAVSNSVPAVGVWTHLTAVWNRGWFTRMVLYVNGKWDINTPPTVSAWASNSVFHIGRSRDGASFDGGLSDVRVYNRAMNDADVAALADPAVGRYRLNGNTGDSSWFLRDGSPRPEVTSWVPAAVPGQRPVALALPGQLTAEHAIAIDVRPRVLHTERSYTVAAWVRLTDANADGVPDGTGDMVAVAQDGEFKSAFALRYLRSEDKWAFVIPRSDINNPSLQIVKSSGAAGLGWTHLAGVFHAEAGQMQLYVNGQAVSATPVPAVSWPATLTFHLGHAKDGMRFTGEIDDVRVYQKVLSANEIQQIHAEPRG